MRAKAEEKKKKRQNKNDTDFFSFVECALGT